MSTPEQKCIGWPEQKYISEAGKIRRPAEPGALGLGIRLGSDYPPAYPSWQGKVISGSTFDLQVVLETLVKSAAKLCDADIATIWRPEGQAYRVAATYQTTVAHKEYLANFPIKPDRGSCVGRTLLEAKIVRSPTSAKTPNTH